MSLIDLDALEALTGGGESLAAFRHVRRWLYDDTLYTPVPVQSYSDAPKARLSSAHIARLIEVGTIRRIDPIEVRGHVDMFKVPEPAKRRWRPIKHPKLINEVLDRDTLLKLRFPSKKDIIQLVHRGRHMISLDMSSYFDQFAYSDDVAKRFCFRHGGEFYRLAKLAMGQRAAVEVAQKCTERLLDFNPSCAVESIIDNVIFVSDNLEDVIRDATTFVERVQAVGAQLNEDVSDIPALACSSGEWCGLQLDLAAKTVQLAKKTVDKTQVSWANRRSWTCRQFAAHVGLLWWSHGIIDVSVADFFPLLRFISRVGTMLTDAPAMWDEPIYVWPSVWDSLERWTTLLLRNQPRRVVAPSLPQWVMATDASAWGWGYFAFNNASGEIRAHGERWSRAFVQRVGEQLGRSTFSEPQAIRQSLCHLLRVGDPQHVVILTDNTVAQAS